MVTVPPGQDQKETFSFIRFAEYRPQTFTADLTFEIPTLAQFITDETYQPINMKIYLELTSLTIINITLICNRIEELLSTMFKVGKESFHIFPPINDSFSLEIDLMQYSVTTATILTRKFSKSFDQMQNTLFKGLGREIERWIVNIHKTAEQTKDYDPTRWNFQKALDYIKEQSTKEQHAKIKELNLMMLSCWNTESSFEDLIQILEPFEEAYVPWHYLLVISPMNSITTALADLLEVPIYNILVDEKNLSNLQLMWKNTLLTLIEPIIEVTINPTVIGSNYLVANNLSLFQNQKPRPQGFILYNIRSQRYPIRINFLFKLPVQEQKTNQIPQDPVVLEKLELKLKTSLGEEFKREEIKNCLTYRLPAGESQYQPERELNNRMRRGEKLKTKLKTILNQQSELNAQIKKMIVEPNFLQEAGDETTIKDSIDNLKLAFEIVNYLQEQELLLAELPPTAKMFQPPQNNNGIL